jgi:glycerol-3-phosphate dehydrogenase
MSRLSELASSYDTVIIGGGITGAGLVREAVRTGARVLLVEQGDFGSGTSSWSSKLVHGGLRYLKTGQWRLTLESVRERQRLLREAPGLITPQKFLMPIYRGSKPGKLTMRLGIWLYDRMAGNTGASWLEAEELLKLEPDLRRDGLLGAMQYMDAGTDDARMVLRLILEAVAEGATAMSYVKVRELLREGERIVGVHLQDAETAELKDIRAGVVINATGAWADRLPGAPASGPKLRPLRGSHFIFAQAKLPIRHAVSWLHPQDARPIFAYPWEGATVYGTTDLDHGDADIGAARMTPKESEYLIHGLSHQFPNYGLRASDSISVYSGVRPVVASGKADPSAESRETAMWSDPGLVSLAGGKLTTFRITARQVLQEASRQVPQLMPLEPLPVFAGAADSGQSRLSGRLGTQAQRLLAELPREEQVLVEGTPYRWAELRWAARHERVMHLGDLMMRRTRIGLVMPQGGVAILPRIGSICRDELGWDAARWAKEETEYRTYWQSRHAPPKA